MLANYMCVVMKNRDLYKVSETIIDAVNISTNFRLSDELVHLNLLEESIFEDVDTYCSKSDGALLESIFHKIQIWSGIISKNFYTKSNTHGDFNSIKVTYLSIVTTCLELYIDFEKDDSKTIRSKLENLVAAVRLYRIPNIGPTIITKHIRFWTHHNLRGNALPVYDNDMAYYYMKKTTPRENSLANFWERMILDSKRHGKSLVEFEHELMLKFHTVSK